MLFRSAWVRALAAQGVTARVADGRSAADADALAARYAMDAVALRIRSDEAREADRRAVRRSAWLTAAAAAVLGAYLARGNSAPGPV